MNESQLRSALDAISHDPSPAASVTIDAAIRSGRRTIRTHRIFSVATLVTCLVVAITAVVALNHNDRAASVATRPSALATPPNAGVAVLVYNTVVEPDGTVTKLDAPDNAQVHAAVEVPSGYVFTADAASSDLFFQPRGGQAHRIGATAGGFAVSRDGSRLIAVGATGTDTVIALSLPDLTQLGQIRYAPPGGASAVAVDGGWALLGDAQGGASATALAWDLVTSSTITLYDTSVFDIAHGMILRRYNVPDPSANGEICYDDVPAADALNSPSGYCTTPPAGGVDAGMLSPDGAWAAISLSGREDLTLVRVRDLHAATWRPVTLPVVGVPTYWDSPTSVIVAGPMHYERCFITGGCVSLSASTANPIVVRDGF